VRHINYTNKLNAKGKQNCYGPWERHKNRNRVFRDIAEAREKVPWKWVREWHQKWKRQRHQQRKMKIQAALVSMINDDVHKVCPAGQRPRE